MPLTLDPPPPTPAEPLTEVLHGVPVTDPYRWLEDQDSPRTREWIDRQTAYARAYFDAIPGRKRIRKRVAELLGVGVISEPWKVGSRYFCLKRAPHAEQSVIVMREGEKSDYIPLVGSEGRDDSRTVAVNILNISGDGRYLAYSVRRGGQDCCSIEFLDVDRREKLRDCLPSGFHRGLVFAPERGGVYYSHETIGTARPFHRAVSWHKFGTSSHEDIEVFFGGDDPKLRVILFGSPDGRQLGYCKMLSADPVRTDFLLHDVATGSAPQLIAKDIEGLFAPYLLDDKVIALTYWGSPNGRIVLINSRDPQPEDWYEIVPEAKARIQGFAVTGGRVFVGFVEDATTRVKIFDFAGNSCGILPCPPLGTAHTLPSRPDSDTAFFSFTSFSQAPTIFRYNTSTSKHETWAQSQVPFHGESMQVDRVEYASKDGTKVPLFLVAQKGQFARSLPTFLTGYGGFGTSLTPQFTAYATFLIEHGFLFAVANVRGGSELGEQWHLAAKRQKRQKAIDDFIAAAEWLLSEGHTAPRRMAIGGGSNAGLLVGAALTQRPDLFRAAVCLGPLLDMVRYHRFDQANFWIEEYGCAENESDFHCLLPYSPYHRVKDGVDYPAVLLVSGDADTRCNPLHARKMAGRLQAATSSGNPILLDYRPLWGHMPVQPLSARIEALTDRLGFICHELGAPG
jgi:prolyl oligopeptidase